jgi:hypothetical protein
MNERQEVIKVITKITITLNLHCVQHRTVNAVATSNFHQEKLPLPQHSVFCRRIIDLALTLSNKSRLTSSARIHEGSRNLKVKELSGRRQIEQ